MSIQVMNAVWNYSKAEGRARLVLLAIADHQGEIGAWPSVATIARMVNASERSVQRDLKALQDLGELKIEERSAPTGGRYRANRYWVTLVPDVEDPEQGVTDSTQGVTNSAQGVTAGGVLTLIRNLDRNNSSPAEPGGALEGFDLFWQIYPKKVEKADAKKAWIKALAGYDLKRNGRVFESVPPVAPEVIIEGARRFANDPNLPPRQFVPYPASWLNAGAWDSEPLPERQKTAEEKAAEAKQKADAQRAAALAQTEREMAESAAAKAAAVPAPKCEHGKTLVRCLPCLKRVAPGA